MAVGRLFNQSVNARLANSSHRDQLSCQLRLPAEAAFDQNDTSRRAIFEAAAYRRSIEPHAAPLEGRTDPPSCSDFL